MYDIALSFSKRFIMNNYEDIIRDKLAKRLDLFPDSLELIDTEYYIPKLKTTRAFIDILAKDSKNNYVIIELKRSNQSARETIHEIYKYNEALKEKLRVNSGEIKSYVVSTEWEELLVPFSAFTNETKNTVKGFKLTTSKDYEPEFLSLIEPLSISNGRLFSPIHEINLYSTKDNLLKGIENHKKILKQKNIKDYVLIIMEREALDDKKVHESMRQIVASLVGIDPAEVDFNFDAYIVKNLLIYTVFQRQSSDVYLDVLKKSEKFEEIQEFIKDNEGDKETILQYLEENIFAINPTFYSEESEIGYPAKFSEKLLRDKKWKINQIIRSKSLNENSLLTNEVILSEIKGDTGAGGCIFHGDCDIDHKGKVNEIKEKALETLKENKVWYNHFKIFIEKIENLLVGHLTVDVYAPNHILLTIHKITTSEDFLEWLPHYIIKYETEETRVTYLGYLSWNQEAVDIDTVLDMYYGNDPFMILFPLIWGGNDDNNKEIMDLLGFRFESYKIEENPEGLQVYHYDNFEFVRIESKTIPNGLFEFCETEIEFVINLNEIYNSYSVKQIIN